MTDLTYTAQGSFKDSKELNLMICIPREPAPDNYKTEFYNLSKNTAGEVVNVVFCHFSDGTDNPMHHNTFDYELNFDLNNLLPFDGAASFDERKSETLFLFFHNQTCTEEDRLTYFDTIEKLHEDVVRNGNHSQDGFTNNVVHKSMTVPRKVGLSLVIKTGVQ